MISHSRCLGTYFGREVQWGQDVRAVDECVDQPTTRRPALALGDCQMRSYRLVILFTLLASTSWHARVEAQTSRGRVEAQTSRDEAALSTLIVVGRQIASEVIRDHAEEMRSIAVLEGCDHKDLALPLREKFKPDWRALAEQHIELKRNTSPPFYFMPMMSFYGSAATEGLINGYTAAVHDLLAAGVIDKAFCQPENLQKFLH